MRVAAPQVAQILVFIGELLLGKPCDVKRSRIELIGKPKVFIELGYGLEDRLEQPQINVLKEVKAAKLDL